MTPGGSDQHLPSAGAARPSAAVFLAGPWAREERKYARTLPVPGVAGALVSPHPAFERIPDAPAAPPTSASRGCSLRRLLDGAGEVNQPRGVVVKTTLAARRAGARRRPSRCEVSSPAGPYCRPPGTENPPPVLPKNKNQTLLVEPEQKPPGYDISFPPARPKMRPAMYSSGSGRCPATP